MADTKTHYTSRVHYGIYNWFIQKGFSADDYPTYAKAIDTMSSFGIDCIIQLSFGREEKWMGQIRYGSPNGSDMIIQAQYDDGECCYSDNWCDVADNCLYWAQEIFDRRNK